MKCPICRGFDFTEIDLVTDQFEEDLFTCNDCGTVVVKTHGAYVVVKDSAEDSFIGHICECDGVCDGDCECVETLA